MSKELRKLTANPLVFFYVAVGQLVCMFAIAYSMSTFSYDINQVYGVSILFDAANDKTFRAISYDDGADLSSKFAMFRVICQNVAVLFALFNIIFFSVFWDFISQKYHKKVSFGGHVLLILFVLFAFSIVAYNTFYASSIVWVGAADDLQQVMPSRYGDSSYWFTYALGCQIAVIFFGLLAALSVGAYRFVRGELEIQQE